MTLPHCDELFLKYFDRWYDEGDRRRKVHKATCPDVASGIAAPGTPASALTPLRGKTLEEVTRQVETMVSSAAEDWKRDFGATDPVTLAGLAAFDRHFDIKRIRKVIDGSPPEEFSNEYVVLCCELGSVLGSVLRTLRPDFDWVWEWPYWESYLYDPKTTDRFNVFHWAIKKMSAYGVDDGLEAKVRFAAEQPWIKKGL